MEYDPEAASAWSRDQVPLLAEWGRKAGYWRARLRLLPTSDGGRQHAIVNGWRSAWDFGERTSDGVTVIHDAPLLIEDHESLHPGEEAIVRLHPLVPDLWPRRSQAHELWLWEGRRIGEAHVIEHVAGAQDQEVE